MRTKNELYQQALRTVAMRRQTARALAQDAQAEAEAAIPGLRHAEEEVRVRGIRCAIAGASGKDRTETAAALAAAKQKLTALLAASGRPADALEPKFTCKRCEDTGAVDGRTCDCVRRVMPRINTGSEGPASLMRWLRSLNMPADDIHAVNHAGAIQQRPRPAFLCHQPERGHRQLAAGQFGIKHTGQRHVFLTHTEKLVGIPFTDTGI